MLICPYQSRIFNPLSPLWPASGTIMAFKLQTKYSMNSVCILNCFNKQASEKKTTTNFSFPKLIFRFQYIVCLNGIRMQKCMGWMNTQLIIKWNGEGCANRASPFSLFQMSHFILFFFNWHFRWNWGIPKLDAFN